MTEIIPFYGVIDPDMFEIERRCMECDGQLIRYVDEHMPVGSVLDLGAGNGYTAARLNRPGRQLVACEPSAGMVDPDVKVCWTRGTAQHLPLKDDSIDGAYSTWAFFFPQWLDVQAGVDELHRVVKPGGRIVIADNAGEDAFCSTMVKDLTSDAKYWDRQGFERTVLESAYRFDNLEEAYRLFEFYWSHNGRTAGSELELEIAFDIAVYEKVVV